MGQAESRTTRAKPITKLGFKMCHWLEVANEAGGMFIGLLYR